MSEPLEALREFNERMQAMPAERAQLINAARADHTWREIAAVLGMTEHGVIKASKVTADS